MHNRSNVSFDAAMIYDVSQHRSSVKLFHIDFEVKRLVPWHISAHTRRPRKSIVVSSCLFMRGSAVSAPSALAGRWLCTLGRTTVLSSARCSIFCRVHCQPPFVSSSFRETRARSPRSRFYNDCRLNEFLFLGARSFHARSPLRFPSLMLINRRPARERVFASLLGRRDGAFFLLARAAIADNVYFCWSATRGALKGLRRWTRVWKGGRCFRALWCSSFLRNLVADLSELGKLVAHGFLWPLNMIPCLRGQFNFDALVNE